MKRTERLNLALQILSEECAETVVASSKIIRFGLDSVSPIDGTHNIDNLIQEMGDTLAMIHLVSEEIGIDEMLLYEAASRKMKKLKTFAAELFL